MNAITSPDVIGTNASAAKLAAAITDNPGRDTVQLATIAGIGKSTAGKLLAEWDKAGLVVRTVPEKGPATWDVTPEADAEIETETADGELPACDVCGSTGAHTDGCSEGSGPDLTEVADAEIIARYMELDGADAGAADYLDALLAEARRRWGTEATELTAQRTVAGKFDPAEVAADIRTDADAATAWVEVAAGKRDPLAFDAAPEDASETDEETATPAGDPIVAQIVTKLYGGDDDADAEASAVTAAAESGDDEPKVRLRSGGLRDMVAEQLADSPTTEYTPSKLAKILDRSSGAIANALERMVAAGEAVRTNDKPKTYQHVARGE